MGSASAKPFSCAKRKASSKLILFSVIFVSIKLVVPFNIPINLFILFEERFSLMVLIIGIPPPILASNLKVALLLQHISYNSLLKLATTALLAVTTCLFFNRDDFIYSKAGDNPPNNSTTISILSSSKISFILSVTL